MVTGPPASCPGDQFLPLGRAFALTELSFQQLYWGQLGIGGSLCPGELEAVLFGDINVDSHAHNILAQTINEALMDDRRPERAAFTL